MELNGYGNVWRRGDGNTKNRPEVLEKKVHKCEKKAGRQAGRQAEKS